MHEKPPELKVQEINDTFFGEEKTNRYIVHIYRECIDKLIITNTLVEVWSRTKGAHEHARGNNCVHCAVFFQIYNSCADSLFLHLRLLFSREEPCLADALLRSIGKLDIEDFKSYYITQYEHVLIDEEIKSIKPLFTLTAQNLSKLSELYMKRIEPYQSFAFHQPHNGKYYKVNTTQSKGEGIKFVTHTKNQKFKRDLAAAKNMLDLIAEVIHLYLKASSKYFHIFTIYPQNYIREISALLGVELSETVTNELTEDTVKRTKKMIHVLECGGGLNAHNGLVHGQVSHAMKRINDHKNYDS